MDHNCLHLLIAWGGFDDKGNRVVKTFCVDSRMCGHSAQESAESIKIVANLLNIALPDLQHSSATSDWWWCNPICSSKAR
jgi:hypothetical protein